eukprot:scaffold947_cov375-Prasinococcus_capsulatus_cf.AAC.18
MGTSGHRAVPPSMATCTHLWVAHSWLSNLTKPIQVGRAESRVLVRRIPATLSQPGGVMGFTRALRARHPLPHLERQLAQGRPCPTAAAAAGIVAGAVAAAAAAAVPWRLDHHVRIWLENRRGALDAEQTRCTATVAVLHPVRLGPAVGADGLSAAQPAGEEEAQRGHDQQLRLQHEHLVVLRQARHNFGRQEGLRSAAQRQRSEPRAQHTREHRARWSYRVEVVAVV